jgi:hypothetical protein
MINLKQIEIDTKRVYENSFELLLMQEELENMLIAIDKNNMAFEKGKISKNAFRNNEKKLQKNSVRVIKNIKNMIEASLIIIKNLIEEIEIQQIKKFPEKKLVKPKKIKVENSGSN